MLEILFIIIVFISVIIIVNSEKNPTKHNSKYNIEHEEILLGLKNIRKEFIGVNFPSHSLYLELDTLDKWRGFDKNKFISTVFDRDPDTHLSFKESLLGIEKDLNTASTFLKKAERYYKGAKEKSNIMNRFFMIISIKVTISIYISKYNQVYNKPIYIITYTYTSTKGRNYYRNRSKVYLRDMKDVIENIEERNQYKETIQYQRNLMTPGLRFDILKRDNYICQVCGATTEMGAKLHVDHIKPISKGGLTEKNNLQTLCQTCNLGKSNKY